jgi:N-acetylneuraminate synthase
MNNWYENLVVFELANNHQGNVEHARYIIEKLGEVSKKYGLNAAVKFQYRDLDTFIHPDYKHREDVKHIPRFLATRLSSEVFFELVTMVREQGLRTMCTPFDERSVDVCVEHGIELLKVASCSATDWPLLEKIAKANKPIIVSTGGKTYSDIDNIYNFFTHRDTEFALLHCVGMYPVDEEHAQLNCIDRMIRRYDGIPIGYSGHENPKDFTIAKMALAKGATILERHIGHAIDDIKLNAYSTEVDEIEGWIEAVLSAITINGDAEKKFIDQKELDSLNELARGCFAARNISQGEFIKREDIFFAMPCQAQQTTSGQYSSEMIASRDYEVNEPLFEERSYSVIAETRSIVHEIKATLLEAKIVIGKEFELELSHHYGIGQFREFGAAIINIINREYCKKIIVLLPEQYHPVHYHQIKEETFQVLYGTLQLNIDGEDILVRTGEIFTVERGIRHSFFSETGCVFEEVSTTHVRNDSYYDDERIRGLDPMQRKTILKEW